jgi:hypothetical protein
LNVSSRAEVERTVHHEMIHALDCCRNGLETCTDHICSEIAAYYEADCQWVLNRMECALGQMRTSMAGKTQCAAEVALANERTAHACLRKWKEQW